VENRRSLWKKVGGEFKWAGVLGAPRGGEQKGQRGEEWLALEVSAWEAYKLFGRGSNLPPRNNTGILEIVEGSLLGG